MADAIDELGPVDYLVVEFPTGKTNFTGEMVKELTALVESGTVRVLDLLLLYKDDRGEVEAFGIDDLEEADEVRVLEAHAAAILAAEDVPNLAAAMENGSAAGDVVWENCWAAPFASAVRRSGGSSPPRAGSRSRRSLPSSRPTRKLGRAGRRTDMPMRPVRVMRRGLIGAPVARTAATVRTAGVVGHGANRRMDRRDNWRDCRRGR